MFKNRKALALLLVVCASVFYAQKKNKFAGSDTAAVVATPSHPVLWKDPQDISTRDLLNGPGGPEHQPHQGFSYLEEDTNGTSIKFDVRDADGVKWRVKLGPEARPETVTTRLVWAVGYSTNEDYFLRDVHVDNMGKLKRKHADRFISATGDMHNARLKRMEEEKKTEQWAWRDNPFLGTREFNGLRVMMALVNNWDLKDVNNGIYRLKEKKHKKDKDGDAKSDDEKDEKSEKSDEALYEVSDLGASFGAPGIAWRFSRSKDNLDAYAHSKFITAVHGDSVDFATPGRPAMWDWVHPNDCWSRTFKLTAIGRRVPRADARWIGSVLARLSEDQIRSAFRAGGYSDEEAGAYTKVVMQRISDLNKL